MSGASSAAQRWVKTQQRVIYADTDAMGVMYYGNYMRFLEIGRCEYLRAKGSAYSGIEAEGYFIPVAEVGLKYLASARYDDMIEIATRIERLRHVSVRFAYRLSRVADGELLAEGFTRHACLDRKGKLVRMPEQLLEALRDSSAES